MLHPLLLRQLKKMGLDDGTKLPDKKTWEMFLDEISRAYKENDQDRYTFERSLAISSREMSELYENLKAKSDRLVEANTILNEQVQERIATEEMLRASTFRMIALIEHLPGGNLVEDEFGRIVRVNQELCKLFSIQEKSDAMIGRGEILVADSVLALMADPEKFLSGLEKTVQSRKIVTGEEILLRDGRILERDYFPLFVNYEYKGHLWQYVDVTEMRKTNLRLDSAERMASVGLLAAGVAHEINNPLAYVMANLSLIKSDLLDLSKALSANDCHTECTVLSGLIEMITEVREGSEQIKEIVKGLKTFSRIEHDRTDIVDVRRALDLATKLASNEIKHRAQLIKDYSDVPMVKANEPRLVQVFLNLLVNAAQATPEGRTSSNTIRVVTKTNVFGRVVIEIIDTGCGMPPETLKKIFDPFFTTKAVGLGTGLGLSICHNILTAIGGEVEVESQLGKGTLFRISLPAMEVPVSQMKAEDLLPQPPSMRGRILLIDDELNLARALQRCLQKDHEVVIENSGKGGVEAILKDGNFDMIFCDLMMPDLTGMEVYSIVSKQAPQSADRMVFMTGGAFSAQATSFVEKLSPERLLEKPFDLSLIRAFIQKKMDSRRLG